MFSYATYARKKRFSLNRSLKYYFLNGIARQQTNNFSNVCTYAIEHFFFYKVNYLYKISAVGKVRSLVILSAHDKHYNDIPRYFVVKLFMQKC